MTEYELPEADHGISALQVQAGYVKRGLPVVIRTLASSWPISQACNLASLGTIYGDVEVASLTPVSTAHKSQKTVCRRVDLETPCTGLCQSLQRLLEDDAAA